MPQAPSQAAPGSDEARYQESERRAMDRWQGLATQALAEQQMDRRLIPSWLNAPEWAEWIGYCSSRGWVFLSEEPHVFGDGHVSAHVARMTPANQVPGVLFYPNNRHYTGQGTPHWVCDRRRALASSVSPGRVDAGPTPKNRPAQ